MATLLRTTLDGGVPVTVVNPSLDVAERFDRLNGPAEIVHFASIGDFVQTALPDGPTAVSTPALDG